MNRIGVVSIGVLLVLGACSSDAKKSTTTAPAIDTVAVTTANSATETPTAVTAAGDATATSPAATTGTNSSVGGATSATGDPCAAVTAEDVATAFGGTATAGVLNESKDGCDYDISGTTKTGEAGITFVSITLGGSYISYDDEKKVFPDVIKVDGVGDAAWYFKAASQLHIDIGAGKEIVISGSLPGDDDAAIQAEVIEFGKIVVAKVG